MSLARRNPHASVTHRAVRAARTTLNVIRGGLSRGRDTSARATRRPRVQLLERPLRGKTSCAPLLRYSRA